MKKILPLLLLLCFVEARGQNRFSLYEEFSGENCSPCAAANTGLWSLLNANSALVMGIMYPTPLPSAGPIYMNNAGMSNARLTYYGISNAPSGRLNGTKLGTGTAIPSTPGHVSNLTQSDINTESSSSTPFTIAVTHTWFSNGDSVQANITITALSNFAPTGANMKLRLALVEPLLYTVAPGTNGERSFQNVVRDMFPDANGSAIPNTWTTSQTQNLIVKGIVPKYVNKANQNTVLVAWIQNDADKSIVQAAKSAFVPLVLDAGSIAHNTIERLQCVSASTMLPSSATLHNGGTTTLTSAKIYYRVDNGPSSIYNWTGNLGAGASTIVNLPAMTVGGGNHYFVDSVALPNGSLDMNLGNNVASGLVNIYNTNKNNLPIASGFELNGALPANWLLYDADSNNLGFTLSKSNTATPLGRGGSRYFLRHANYIIPSGEANYAILPAILMPTGDWTFEFYVAHAQFDNENDKLEVVYSTDCGSNWTSVYSEAGAALAAVPATHNYYEPAAADWAHKLLILNTVPAGAMLAFRATSNFGNNLYIDDVHLHTGAGAAGVNSVIMENAVSVYPNPATASATIGFTINKAGNVSVSVTDAVGRTVADLGSRYLQKGMQSIPIPVSTLAAGVYTLRVQTDGSSVTKQLAVLK
jgi:hypothetical protein